MTELPESLLRFDALLERSIERDLRRGRRRERRRVAVRVAVGAAGAGAIAFGATSLLADDASVVGRSVVGLASAQERAAAALSPARDGVVHVVASTRHVAPDGSVATWREETWRQTVAPYARREITTRGGAGPVETATAGRGPAHLYDPSTDTIYTDPPDAGPALGTPMPARDGDPLRTQLLGLLRSGDARAVAEATHDGRRAIRFELRDAWPDGSVVRWTYVVDAESYEPLVLTAETPDGARTTTRFERYETLAGDARGEALLDLGAQHPDAAIDATERGYAEAQARVHGLGAPAGG